MSPSLNDEAQAGITDARTDHPLLDASAYPAPRPPAELAAPERIDAIAEAVNHALGKHVSAVDGQRGLLTEQGVEAAHEVFASSPTAKALDTAELELADWIATVERKPAEVIAKLSNPKASTADELRNSRAWDRSVRELDAADNGHLAAKIRDIVTAAAESELGVLAAELPAYARSRGIPEEAVTAALKARVPELASAYDEVARARRTHTLLAHKLAAVRTAVGQRRAATVLPKLAKIG